MAFLGSGNILLFNGMIFDFIDEISSHILWLKYHGLVKIILSPGDAIDVRAAQNAWLDPDVIPILV